MLRHTLSSALVATGLMIGVAHAFEMGTRDEAVVMVQRVQERFRSAGEEATFKAVNIKEFNDHDLYPFICDFSGVVVGNGGFPALVGKNLISLRDQDGRHLTQEMISIAKGPGSGWITYKWPNPQTRKMEEKSAYIERMGDYLVGVGIYPRKH
ncbi:MAG: histidine kinase [Hyphomicrobiaceae bacterium]|nr:MAG: histidine kinase [Hyphomicrobiaceae bacterium]